jgi:exosome complex RNA-binding protein Rrp42 (RNase PH superfamily)
MEAMQELDCAVDPSARAIILQSHYNHGRRLDMRSFAQYRPLKISSNMLRNDSCFGSSLVHLGDTSVTCGISLLCGTPSYESSDCGDIGISR